MQLPNVPFIVAAAGLLVSAITTGSRHDYAIGFFYAALAVWAWLELTSGVNWVKRLLCCCG